MLSPQEMFNIVYNGLRNQGWKQSIAADIGCAYRAGDCKCAFGHLIPDEVYHETLEGLTAERLLNGEDLKNAKNSLENIDVYYKVGTEMWENAKVEIEHQIFGRQRFYDWSLKNFDHADIVFIQELQLAHDDMDSCVSMQRRIEAVGIKWGLTVPA